MPKEAASPRRQRHGGVHVLAANTDGTYGIEDNVGAIVTPDTLARAGTLDLKAVEQLDCNNGHVFFGPGRPVHTGASYTNVNEFRALLILEPAVSERVHVQDLAGSA